ncbi:MAG TPA: translation initiation inhibitor, partial [Armatimonadota bacterium]|nr:translation initiation inhibitor [Armatimonadota bacterium]
MVHGISRISCQSIDCGVPATVRIACFQGKNGVDEYHLMISPTTYGSTETQLSWVRLAYQRALASLSLDAETGVLRRFFCSDLPNQATILEAAPFANPHTEEERCAVSWVCQPPAPPAKVALWAYHIAQPEGSLEKQKNGTTLTLKRDELSHIWTTGLIDTADESSYDQTKSIFKQYVADLQMRGLTLADNVVRTWLFVQNVDANYHGVVVARREFFTEQGLTSETHYIASTGIAGTSADVTAKVLMDAYAIAGVRPEQIQYLEALDNLCPTHVYGVTFERGVAVAYRDRKHIMISGTASIDS